MVSSAIILAGGFGKRLQTVVNDVPKPMAPINGEPFLTYQLRYLSHFKFKKVILSTGYLSDTISSYYQGSFLDCDLVYAVEKEPLGTGGGIRLAMEHCEDNEVLVLNGDSFFDIDISRLYSFHSAASYYFSLALRKVNNAGRYGTITLNENQKITSFREKSGDNTPGLINAGVYLLNKAAFIKNTPAATNFSIEKDFFEKEIHTIPINGIELDGYFIDIGIPEDYLKAQHDFKEFKYR